MFSPRFLKPDPVIEHNRNFFHRFDKSKKLSDYSFVVFDTELTGLNRHKDEIISIGAIRIENLQIDLGKTFNETIQPENIDHTDATLIHRITPEKLQRARPLDQVLPEFIEFLQGSILIGHYVQLDTDFINKATKKHFGGRLANPAIDTMLMAHGYKKVLLEEFHADESLSHSYNLCDLSKEFKLPPYQAHDAFEDAMQTAYLFLFLLKKYKISTLLRHGHLRNLKDLLKAGRIRNRLFQ